MKEQHLEQKVGAFVLIGLIVIAGLIISFGQFGQTLTSTYTIIGEFPNASGIIKNSQVLYRGARVGTVVTPPQIAHEGEVVEVTMQIRKDVHLPKNADFRIGIYGLLGDRFVDVVPPKEEAMEKGAVVYLKNGDRVRGGITKGINDFLEEAQAKLQHFDAIMVDIQSKILTEEFVHNFHEAMNNARNVLERGDRIMAAAEKGKGPLHTILKDEQTARNLRDFIYNIKETGPLFYRNVSEDPPKPSKPLKLPR